VICLVRNRKMGLMLESKLALLFLTSHGLSRGAEKSPFGSIQSGEVMAPSTGFPLPKKKDRRPGPRGERSPRHKVTGTSGATTAAGLANPR
jgi:hypothetical protein